MAGTVSEVTDNNFQAEVIESETPVLVDFWAPWCGPCRMVAPVVEEIATERADQLKVVKLNIDENQKTADRVQVMSIPTLILFRNGQPAKTVIGAYPKRRLEAELEPALALAGGPRGACRWVGLIRPARRATRSSRPSMAACTGAPSRGPPERLLSRPGPRASRAAMYARGGPRRPQAERRRRRASARSGPRPRSPASAAPPGRRGRSRAPALAAQLVVERQLQRDRVRALALELVALERLHREQQVVGAPSSWSRPSIVIADACRPSRSARGHVRGIERRDRVRRPRHVACRSAGRARGSWA